MMCCRNGRCAKNRLVALMLVVLNAMTTAQEVVVEVVVSDNHQQQQAAANNMIIVILGLIVILWYDFACAFAATERRIEGSVLRQCSFLGAKI